MNNNFYNKNALKYFKNTYHLDLSELYIKFLPYVKDQGLILDIGAGSGRDSYCFLNKGYKVTSIDTSKELNNLAKRYLNINVINVDILDFLTEQKYDAIWACASLLHLNDSQLIKVFQKLPKVLNKNAVVYMSFKLGNFSGLRDGRFFNDMNIEKLNQINNNNLILEKYWITDDVFNRKQKWLNVIYLKEKHENTILI